MWVITARFNLFGFQTREIDLTPALGVALILIVVGLIAHNTWGIR